MKSQFRTKALLALAILYLSVLLDQIWIWGLMLALMVLQDFQRGSTHLFEELTRQEHPLEFHLVEGSWLLLALATIAWDLKLLA